MVQLETGLSSLCLSSHCQFEALELIPSVSTRSGLGPVGNREQTARGAAPGAGLLGKTQGGAGVWPHPGGAGGKAVVASERVTEVTLTQSHLEMYWEPETGTCTSLDMGGTSRLSWSWSFCKAQHWPRQSWSCLQEVPAKTFFWPKSWRQDKSVWICEPQASGRACAQTRSPRRGHVLATSAPADPPSLKVVSALLLLLAQLP